MSEAVDVMHVGTSQILAHVERGVGWIVFNQPSKRNAMSLNMWRGLGVAAGALQDDPRVQVVIMKGAGDEAFASGADISEFEKYRSNSELKRSYAEVSELGMKAIANISKPLIAMISGHCLGAGLLIALASDVRIAADNSKFAVPAAKLGLGLEYHSAAALARVVGPSAAKDMLFSARAVDSTEALRLGLVNKVVPGAELEEYVTAYAARIAGNAPLTVRLVKKAIQLFEDYSQTPEARQISEMSLRCYDSEDYKEGRVAFLEKRSPHFIGK